MITDVEPPQVSASADRGSTDGVFGLEMVEVAASDNKTVQHLSLRIDGQLVHEALDSTGFIYLWETADSGVGSKPVVSASAEDAAGNQSSARGSSASRTEPVGGRGSRLGMAAAPTRWRRERHRPVHRRRARAGRAGPLLVSELARGQPRTRSAVDLVMAELRKGGDTAITFDLIHSTVLSTYPEPYHSFTDPGFAEAFSDYAAEFAARHAPTYLFVGNEANIYLAEHPDEVAGVPRRSCA